MENQISTLMIKAMYEGTHVCHIVKIDALSNGMYLVKNEINEIMIYNQNLELIG